MLPQNYEITVSDLQSALAREGLTLEPGDAVLIHTGWGKLWGKDNAKYNSGCPGIGVAAAEWLAQQDVMLLGSDNFPVEIAPNPDKNSEPAGASDRARGQRHILAGEPQAGRARGEASVRVRLHRPAAQDQRRHGIDGGARRGSLSGAERNAGDESESRGAIGMLCRSASCVLRSLPPRRDGVVRWCRLDDGISSPASIVAGAVDCTGAGVGSVNPAGDDNVIDQLEVHRLGLDALGHRVGPLVVFPAFPAALWPSR